MQKSRLRLNNNLSDAEIIDRYKEVFQRFAKDGVIDMDKRLKHKFSYQIHRLEDIIPKLNGVVPPYRQSMYYITLFRKGAARKSVGLFNFEIKNNTLLLIPQRVIHSTLYDSLHASGYLLNFNIEFFLNNAFPKKLISEKKVFKSSLKPYLYLSASKRKQLETIFEYIFHENSEAAQGKNQMIAIKILELLILCDRLFTEAESVGGESIYHPTIEKFNQLIEENFSKERAVEFYADKLNIHPGHLNYLMKKHNGLNAKKTIDNRLVMEAQSLLVTTAWSIKEIADKLGFSDANYFSSFFTRMTKMTPTAYRAKVG
ncbi:AraC family transcriptional regulator [Puia dinghuensis]|uniref:Transcriptional regulator n=1 Tax=Puia dinghuensis TaxID=1792502 RepID=A0A8J2UDI2_9BACT|nr:AraC family transcriptional regulator [Puia dinghuensis]GGB02434.1 transcriptional regulator [Puia dinghuensis]